LYKELCEVIHVEAGHYLTFDFDAWREHSELKSLLGGQDDADDWIRAVRFDLQVPRIVRLLKYDRLPKNSVKFNRRNIFLRDEHRCQYCGERFPTHRLSLDHVLPRSRGGPTTWENIVCACLECNVRKGGRTPYEARMHLIRQPAKPRRNPLLVRQLDDRRYHSWQNFIPAGME
jgi:5-methylcytosine-specific restriction endonuclease McrA